jgi:hypothetical protein
MILGGPATVLPITTTPDYGVNDPQRRLVEAFYVGGLSVRSVRTYACCLRGDEFRSRCRASGHSCHTGTSG